MKNVLATTISKEGGGSGPAVELRGPPTLAEPSVPREGAGVRAGDPEAVQDVGDVQAQGPGGRRKREGQAAVHDQPDAGRQGGHGHREDSQGEGRVRDGRGREPRGHEGRGGVSEGRAGRLLPSLPESGAGLHAENAGRGLQHEPRPQERPGEAGGEAVAGIEVAGAAGLPKDVE
eukprot:8073808-Pyramimonas_sp.AAC.1